MPRFKRLIVLAWGAMFLMVQGGPLPAQSAPQVGATVYLPLVSRNYDPLATTRRINAPYFSTPDILGQKFSEMGIFWFGRVGSTENYTDVRVAFNDTELVIYTATFDRYAWYDTSPSVNDLTKWDSVSVYLNLTGNSGGAPTANAYRFDAQLVNGGTLPANSKATYRGNGTTWVTTTVPFTATATWRGGNVNDNTDDRAWVGSFRIPFASLGVSRPTANVSSAWGLAMAVHDRDDAGGTPIADTFWPESVDFNSTSTWAQLRWGLPVYTPPSATSPQITTLRHGLNGVTVLDADLGGTVNNQCPGDSNFIWNQWGNTNYGSATGLNVQNQDDVADWPCFAKTYLAFPLSSIPAGKAIISATLTLHQLGGSGPDGNGNPPNDEYIQVLTVAQDWSENAITWNNAPLALENFGGSWVTTIVGCGGAIAWPCIPRTWDVTTAIVRSYATESTARLVLYSASTGYRTGKYFVSSQAFQGNWPPEVLVGRPTLSVRWGNP